MYRHAALKALAEDTAGAAERSSGRACAARSTSGSTSPARPAGSGGRAPAGASRRSSPSRRASAAASARIASKWSSCTWYEQEQVTRQPPGLQHLERAEVDLLVPALAPSRPRRGSWRTRAGRARSVSKRSPASSSCAQQVEDVRVARGHVRDAAARGVRGHALERLGREVDGQHVVAVAGDLQREAAVVAEAVERAAVGVAAVPPGGSRAGRGTGPSSVRGAGRRRSGPRPRDTSTVSGTSP